MDTSKGTLWQPNTTLPKVDEPRAETQARKILDMLREKPRTNVELNAVAYRYSARLHELRKCGHYILTTALNDGHGTVLYTLLPERQPAHEA